MLQTQDYYCSNLLKCLLIWVLCESQSILPFKHVVTYGGCEGTSIRTKENTENTLYAGVGPNMLNLV